MKWIKILMAVGLFSFWGCSQKSVSPAPDVVVGLPALASIIHSVIAGGACQLSVGVLAPPGAQHVFELTPRQVAQIRQAPLTLMVGAQMDTWLLAARPQKQVQIESWGVLVPRGVTGRRDPHFWLDPKRSWSVAVQVADMLNQHFPDACDHVKAPLQASELQWYGQGLSKKVRVTLGWLSGARVMASHDAFHYFIDFLEELGISVSYHPEQDHGIGSRRLAEILQAFKNPQSRWVVWDVPPFSLCKQLEARLGQAQPRCFRLDPTGSILNQSQPNATYPEFFDYFLSGLQRTQP